MKLVKCEYGNPGKLVLTCEFPDGGTIEILIPEPDDVLLVGVPLEAVERYLAKTYWPLLDFTP